MASIGTLTVDLKADTTNLDRNLSKAQSSLRGVNGSVDKTIGKMALLSAAAVTAATVFAANSVRMAADAEEMRSMFEAVFRGSSREVENWAASFAAATGRSRNSLMKFAANFQDTFVPLGFARTQAAQLSKQLTQLAVDLGSFKNIRADEAANALSSALVGNHEAVRKFGIIITEASLQNELYSMGIEKSTLDVDQMTKVQARLNLIMKSTSDAQGDAVRTSDSATNQFIALEAAVESLSITLGTTLIDATVDAARAVTDIVRKIESVINRFQDVDDAPLQELLRRMAEVQNVVRVLEKSPKIGMFAGDNLEQLKKYRAELEEIKAAIKAIVDPPKTEESGDDKPPKSGGVNRDSIKLKTKLEKELEAFRNAADQRELLLLEEEDREIERNDRRRAKLVEFLEAKLITEDEFRKMSESLESEHSQRLIEITGQRMDKENSMRDQAQRQKERDKRREEWQSRQLQNTLVGIAQDGIQAIFGNSKAAAIASTVISTSEAVMKTFSQLGYPWGIPAAAAVAAIGVAKIASIQSSSPGGGGSVGAIPAGAAAPAAPADSAPSGGGGGQAIAINLEGEIFGPAEVRSLIERINDAIGDGARIRVS